MEKRYEVPDQCVECLHSVLDYDMWICIYHKIDIEEHDCECCTAFEKGCTISNKNKVENIVESLQNALDFSREDKYSLEARFLRDQIECIIKRYGE